MQIICFCSLHKRHAYTLTRKQYAGEEVSNVKREKGSENDIMTKIVYDFEKRDPFLRININTDFFRLQHLYYLFSLPKL